MQNLGQPPRVIDETLGKQFRAPESLRLRSPPRVLELKMILKMLPKRAPTSGNGHILRCEQSESTLGVGVFWARSEEQLWPLL